jgi:WD40 repeat protein
VKADASHRYQGADNNRLSPYGKDGHAVGSRLGRIFLSHSSVDNAKAIGLARWLEREGWDDYFLDLHPHRGIASGERWEKALNEAAQRCQAVVFLISPAWLASRWCVEELHLAHRLNKQIFGVLVEEVELSNVPAKLRDQWQLVDLARGRDHTPPEAVELPDGTERHVTFSRAGLSRLKAGLTKAEIDARFFAWPPESDPARPPYRGMRPLEMEDAGIFYGREAPVIEVLDRLRGLREAASPRFLALLAASGAGKSSFLRAGLLARLHRDDRSFLPLPIVRPDRAVLSGATGFSESLFQALKARRSRTTRAIVERAVSEGASAVAALMEELSSASVADEAGHEDQSNHVAIVLPIDQAEELFQAEGRTEAVEFLNLLAGLLALPAPKLIALVTIRSDSYERLQLAPELENTRQSAFSLPPLPRGSYQIVIEGPAARLKDTDRPLKIDPALTAALLRDVEAGGAKDSLPLLAFTLERLYARHEGAGELTLKNYLDMGGVGGSISAAVERALLRAADDPALPRQRDAQLALLRRAMIPWLAGIDPDTGSPRRQVARMSEIPEEARPLIRHLITERLLSTDTAFAASDSDPVQLSVAGEATVEPAHEALLRQWSLLDGWLKEDAGKLAALEGVKRATRDWEANARDPSWLAHQAGRLEDAEGLNARPDLAARLDASDRAYLAAARAAETERREKDLAEARKLAEAQRRVAARTRIGAIAALFLAVLAGVAWWQSTQQRAIAVENAQLALQKSEEAAAQAAIAEEQARIARAQEVAARKAEAESEQARQDTEVQLRAAQINESRFLASSAEQEAARGNTTRAMALALAALPDDMAAVSPSRPLVADALATLMSLRRIDPLKAVFSAGRSFGRPLEFSPDGTKVVFLDSGAMDVHSGSVAISLEEGAAFSRNWTRIATPTEANEIVISDAGTGRTLATLRGAVDDIEALAFSEDGTWLVASSEDATARIWDVASGTQVALISRQLSDVEPGLGSGFDSVSFSPDGQRVLLVSEGVGQIWDIAATPPNFLRETETAEIQKWSPDGTLLAYVSPVMNADGIPISYYRPRLIDIATGSTTDLTPHEGKRTSDLEFSPDGRLLAVAKDNEIHMWDVASRQSVRILRGHTEVVRTVAFSRDGRRLATGSSDGTTRLWDVASAETLTVLSGHEASVGDVAFSADGGLVATAGSDDTVRIWDVRAASQPRIFGDGEVKFATVEFSRDGRRMLSTSADRASVWDTQTGQLIASTGGHVPVLNEAEFSPDGSKIVTTDSQQTRLWNADDGALIAALAADGSDLVLFSSDSGRVLISSRGYQDNGVSVWDTAIVRELWQIATRNVLMDTAFSPDGRLVAVILQSGAEIRDSESGSMVQNLLYDENTRLGTAAFSADGRYLAASYWNSKIIIWDVSTGSRLRDFKGPESVRSLRFSPDGFRLLAMSSIDSAPSLWDVARGTLVASLEASAGQVIRFAQFSEDGSQILGKGGPRNRNPLLRDVANVGVAAIWDATTGQRTTVFGNDGETLSAAQSPDGTKVVTVSADGKAYVWEAATGALIGALKSMRGDVKKAVYSPNGAHLAVVSSDGTNELWPANTDYATALIVARAAQTGVLDEPARGAYGLARPRDPTPPPDQTECDRLAASPFDPQRLAPGVLSSKIDGPRAEKACEEAVARRPDDPRYRFQLARVRDRQGAESADVTRMYEQAAEKGYAAAFYNLAANYSDDNTEANPIKARENFEEALRLGVLAAAKHLGRIYWFGNGIEADRAKAVSIWRDAANKGEPSAHEMLAWVAELGRDGSAPDLAAALFHYAVAVRIFEEAGLESLAFPLRLHRATLARNLDPQIVAQGWRSAMATVASIRP